MSNCGVFKVPFVSSLTSRDTNSYIDLQNVYLSLILQMKVYFSPLLWQGKIKKCPLLKETNNELEAHIRHMLRCSLGSIIRCENFAYFSSLSDVSQHFCKHYV